MQGPKRRQSYILDEFPTVGCSFGPSCCSSNFYVDPSRFLIDAPGVLKEGYEKYGNRPFKVATMLRWTVVFSDPPHMLEIANAAEGDLSFREAMKDVRPLSSLQITIIDTALEIMGIDDALDINVGSPDHDLLAELLKSHIARNATKICGEVQDELLTSLENVLGNESDDWASIPALGTSIPFEILNMFCRPQLREVFLSGQDVAIMRVIRCLVPSWAFPFFVRMASNLDANVDRGTMLLGSAVEACISEVDEHSVPKQQKIDFLARLVRRSTGEDSLLRNLMTRLLCFTIAVASICVDTFLNSLSDSIPQTPSNTLTHALYHLATNPEVVQALRDEVDSIVQRDGWNIQSVAKMSKMDSFLRESARINGVSSRAFFI
ncbi:hypothetical protein BDR05DRAFT_1001281 [Suillus weaverae]|nr:hypothetical protein BDR05DRAFT_1001281 [Suillus weaverae]